VRPVNAFLIVDVQNDFISGSLDISNCSAQQQGHEVSSGVTRGVWVVLGGGDVGFWAVNLAATWPAA